MNTPLPPPRRRTALRLVAALALASSAVLALKLSGGLDVLSFAGLARHREALSAWLAALGPAAPVAFVLAYAAFTALSLPTGLLMSTLGGFLFGTVWGGLLNVVGATLGATAVFLAARTILGDVLRQRAGPSLRKFEAGFQRDALSYLLVLRLVPLFPFWLVNLAPAFLRVRTWVFVLGTFLGIIPGALVFASVGTGLGAVLDAGGGPDGAVLLQPRILLPIAGLALLALLPILVRRLKPAASVTGRVS